MVVLSVEATSEGPTVALRDRRDLPEGGQPGQRPVVSLVDPGPRRWSGLRVDAPMLVVLVAVAAALRLPSLGTGYWTDEGISVGIASHPLGQIPSLLRLDGSPPLYYVLLHFWIGWFGTSPEATHVLSLIPSLLTIPVLWWATRTLFGVRAARYAALFGAVSAFLTEYGTETRMYSMVALVAVVTVTSFLKGVVAGERRWLGGVVVGGILLTYLHSWGPYLVAAMVTSGLALAWVLRSRALARDVVVCGAVVTACYLPWLPTLLFQVQHTGAPWSAGTNIGEMLIDTGGAFGGGIAVATIAVLVVGYRRSHRPVRSEDRQWRLQIGVLVTVIVFTLCIAALVAVVVPSWDERYLAIVVGPMLMLAAALLSRARPGRIALLAAAGCMVAPTIYHLTDAGPARMWAKSNDGEVARDFGAALRPGDLVISAQLTQIPVLDHYLPQGLTYAGPLGQVSRPSLVDWRNLQARLRTANPSTLLGPLIDALPKGAHVLLVDPYGWSATAAPSAYSELLYAQSVRVNRVVLGDYRQLAVVRSLDPPSPLPNSPVAAILLVKR